MFAIASRRCALGGALALLVFVGLSAGAAVRVDEIEAAHRRNDLATLEAQARSLKAELQASEATPGRDARRTRYLKALVAWRSNHVLRAREDSQAEREVWLLEGRAELERLLAADPENVEALVLQAAILGELSERSLWQRMTLGRIAYQHLETAVRLAPQNPRAALQRGVFWFYAPAFAGGGLEASHAELERARALFRDEAADAWPGWGRVDTAAWLGQALAALGRTQEARARYEEGLAYAPPSPWIREVLLPELAAPSPKP